MRLPTWVWGIVFLLSPAGSALAGFATSVSGNGVLVAPPASVIPGADPNSKYIVFNEQSGTLGSSVTLDESGTDHGGHDGLSTFVPVTLSAGTAYGTTLIQLDPEQAGTVHSGAAVIHFSSKILGIALKSSTLDATDIYGHAGTTYPTGTAGRGIDATHDDKFTIAANGLNLTVNLDASNFGFDQIRIFTAASPVPEPATLLTWLMLSGVAAGLAFARSRSTSVVAS
ncbi:MAG TPA: hypothetical protein VGP63_23775 [Planctomycetaceae bacterium]|nr:hypothetical protein [Planctomycetaceae bacterium]